MGVRANALGSIHIHKIFFFPVHNSSKLSPVKRAEYAIEKIKRNVLMLDVIMTMHVLNVDEVASVSAQEVSAVDITLRILRKSHIPFGGLLLISTMDHKKIQPINQLPFLTLSLVLMCFEAIELKQSVRAHGYIDFQCLQDIMQMNPFQLMNNIVVKIDFF